MATKDNSLSGAIDIHHHYVPPAVIEEAKKHGAALGVEISQNKEGEIGIAFAGGPAHLLHPDLMEVADRRFGMMERGKIAVAAAAPNTTSLGYRLDGGRGEAWCRLYNEGFRELQARHPGRFASLAAAPLQDPLKAAAVLEHAIVELKLSGVMIGSNVNGRYYNTNDFDPFWKKAEELGVLVVMHPEDVAGSERMGPYGLRLICGNPADSALSLGFLTYSGVFDRFPNLKLCVFHGGGFFPYHLGRFDQGFAVRGGSRAAQAGSPPSAYLKNLYFDTLVYRTDTLEYLRQLAGTDHLMVGTDYPYELGDWTAVDRVLALNRPESEKQAILHENARRLLKI